MKKYKNVTQTQKIDPETGQVMLVEVEKNFTIQSSTDKFYMTFIEYLRPYFQIKYVSDQQTLALLCGMAEYNTGVAKLTPIDRDNLCVQLDISKQQLTNSLGRLKKLGLITGERGIFTINPQVFWKGDIKTRDTLLSNEGIKITFNIIN